MTEESSYTERARAWIKTEEPGKQQIQAAYIKMAGKLAEFPEKASPDTDECLELLTTAYSNAGGEIEDLHAAADAGGPDSQPRIATEELLDSGALYETSDAPGIDLDPTEKLAEFQRLKDRFQTKSGGFGI